MTEDGAAIVESSDDATVANTLDAYPSEFEPAFSGDYMTDMRSWMQGANPRVPRQPRSTGAR